MNEERTLVELKQSLESFKGDYATKDSSLYRQICGVVTAINFILDSDEFIKDEHDNSVN